MNRKVFSEEQIMGWLQRVEAAQNVADACREQGISAQTYYRWKAQYGGLPPSELNRVRALEQEHARRKRLLADAMLDNAALKDVRGQSGNTRVAPRSGYAPAHAASGVATAGVPRNREQSSQCPLSRTPFT